MSLTADYCFNDGYVGKHPVALKEYCVELMNCLDGERNS